MATETNQFHQNETAMSSAHPRSSQFGDPRHSAPARQRRLLAVVDDLDWGYGFIAKGLQKHLPEIHVTIVDREHLPDAIHGYDWVLGLSWHHLHRLLPRVPEQVPVLTYLSNENDFLNPRLLECCQRSAVILCSSERILRRMAELHPAFRWRLRRLVNCVDTDVFCPTAWPAAPPLVVGWAGSTLIHGQLKGVELIEQATAGLPDIVFVKRDRAEAQAAEHASMPQWYNRLHAYVNLSESEGGPLTVLEALACGRHVITTEVGVVPELLAQGARLTVVERSAEALRAALEAIRRADLGQWTEHNRAIIQSHWDHKVAARQLRSALAQSDRQARRVALLANYGGIGGASRKAGHFRKALDALGCKRVDTFVGRRGGLFEERLGALPADEADLTGYDVVITSIGANLKRLNSLPEQVKLIVTLATAVQWTYDTLTELDLARVDEWLIVDRKLRKWLREQGVADSWITEIRNPAEPVFRQPTPEERQQARRDLDIEPDARVITYVGRFSAEKNLQDLLVLLRILRLRDPRYRLVLVGAGENEASRKVEASISRQIQLHHLEPHVRKLGAILHDEDLRRVYWATDCMVLASEFEGLPNCLVEAAACGTPFVAPPVGNIPVFAAETGAGTCQPRQGPRYPGPELVLFAEEVERMVKTPPEHIDMTGYSLETFTDTLDSVLNRPRIAIDTCSLSVGGGARAVEAFMAALQGLGLDRIDVYSEHDGVLGAGHDRRPSTEFNPNRYDCVLKVLSRRVATINHAKPCTKLLVMLATNVPWTWKTLEGVEFARPDRWLIVHKQLREYLRAKGVDDRKIIQINTTVPGNFRLPSRDERACARARFGLNDRDKVLLFVGRFAEVKRIPDIIEVLGILARRDPTHKLLLVGGVDPHSDELQHNSEQRIMDLVHEAVATRRLADRVFHAGIVTERLEEAYWASDCLLVTSRYEGLPTSIIEAATCGLPFLAPPIGEIEEFARSTNSGVCVPRAGDRYTAEELVLVADAVERVLQDRPAIGDLRAYRHAALREVLAEAVGEFSDGYYFGIGGRRERCEKAAESLKQPREGWPENSVEVRGGILLG